MDGGPWWPHAALRLASSPLPEAVKQAWYGYPTTDLFGPAKPDSMGWKMEVGFYFYDPAPALKGLHCPFLNLRGGLDAPLTGTPSVVALKASLAAGKTKDYTIHIFPSVGHMLFEARSSNDADLPHETRFAPGFFPLVATWLERVTSSK